MILPSAAKYVQTIGFAYGELIRRLTEFLSRPHCCLITSGFSFGDEHLNRVLATALQNPTLQLIVYLPNLALSDGPPQELIGAGNGWTQALVESQHPQVTFVFGGENAYFDRMVTDLPAPALLDDYTDQARRLARLFERVAEQMPEAAQAEPAAGGEAG